MGVRLENLLFHLSCTVVFVITFPIAMINGNHQSIHILEQDRFTWFLDEDGILDLIRKSLVIVVV